MSHQRAFTYIELMLVLTIIAVLMAIAVPNFLEAKTRAGVARSKAEMAVLKMAVDAYWLENRAYPPNRSPANPGAADLVCLTTPIPYISKLPDDFLTTREARSPRQGEAQVAIGYQYVNGLQLDSKSGLKVLNPEGILGGGYIGALLWGNGPSLISLYPESRRRDLYGGPFTRIQPDGTAQLLPYDPSNGTITGGDIYSRIP